MSTSTFGVGPLHACSACAGDYEDPERTAWDEELRERERDPDEDEGRQLAGDDFPVQRS